MAPDVMGKLRDLLDREMDRHDRESMKAMQRLIITERLEKRPAIIRSRDIERDCRSIVNQLVNSMPKDVLLRNSFRPLKKSDIGHRLMSRPLKKSGSSQNPSSRERYITDAREEHETS